MVSYREYIKHRAELLRQADRAANGSICKNIGRLIHEQASVVSGLLSDGSVKQARVEVGRLISYVEYRNMCGRSPKT